MNLRLIVVAFSYLLRFIGSFARSFYASNFRGLAFQLRSRCMFHDTTSGRFGVFVSCDVRSESTKHGDAIGRHNKTTLLFSAGSAFDLPWPHIIVGSSFIVSFGLFNSYNISLYNIPVFKLFRFRFPYYRPPDRPILIWQRLFSILARKTDELITTFRIARHLLHLHRSITPESKMDQYHHQSMRNNYPVAMNDEYTSQSPPPSTQRAPSQLACCTFVISLLFSFVLGSVILLTATLVWHSDVVLEMTPVAHSNMVESPFVKLGTSIYCRRRRTARQCWM